MKRQMKKIKGLTLFAILMLLFTSGSFAFAKSGKEKIAREESKEKVVTTSLSLYAGKSSMFAQYLSDQEYSGPVLGLAAEFGSMYKRSENLSWDLDATFIGLASGIFQPVNPAGTSAYAPKRGTVDYGTYYNWNLAENLYIKAGGSFDVLFAAIGAGPDHVNNNIEIDFQTQFKVGAGIRYGWNFKKTGLFLQANLEIPFIGMALSGTQYETSIDSIISGELLPGTINPFCFTSFHNLSGFNADLEAELIMRKTTLFLAYEVNHRAWHLYDLHNYRKFNMTRLGIRVDLISRNRNNSINRFF